MTKWAAYSIRSYLPWKDITLSCFRNHSGLEFSCWPRMAFGVSASQTLASTAVASLRDCSAMCGSSSSCAVFNYDRAQVRHMSSFLQINTLISTAGLTLCHMSLS